MGKQRNFQKNISQFADGGLKKCDARLMGMGKMMVELCSAAMLFSVWR